PWRAAPPACHERSQLSQLRLLVCRVARANQYAFPVPPDSPRTLPSGRPRTQTLADFRELDHGYRTTSCCWLLHLQPRRPLNLDIALLSARTPWLLCPSL